MANSYWFKHDDNAKNDEKIENLIYEMGYEGYGLYWGLVENLIKNGGYMKTNYQRIAYALRVEKQKVKQVIEKHDLFIIKNGRFTSKRVLKELKDREAKINRAKKGAKARWENENSDDNSDDKTSNAQADAQASAKADAYIYKDINKEIKNKERKEKKKEKTCEKPEVLHDSFSKELISRFWKYLKANHPSTYNQFIHKKEKVEKDWEETICWLQDNPVDTYSKEEIYNAVKNAASSNLWGKHFRTLNKLKKLDDEGTRYIAKFLEIKLKKSKKQKIQEWINGD